MLLPGIARISYGWNLLPGAAIRWGRGVDDAFATGADHCAAIADHNKRVVTEQRHKKQSGTFERTIAGVNSIPPAAGGGYTNLRMHEDSVGVSLGWSRE